MHRPAHVQIQTFYMENDAQTLHSTSVFCSNIYIEQAHPPKNNTFLPFLSEEVFPPPKCISHVHDEAILQDVQALFSFGLWFCYVQVVFLSSTKPVTKPSVQMHVHACY